MLLRMMNSLMEAVRRINSMPIIKRITVIYTICFSLSMLAASFLIMCMVTAALNLTAKIEIGETLASISEYIEGGGVITVSSIIAQNSNPFVNVEIIDNNTGKNVVKVFTASPIPHLKSSEGGFILKKRADIMRASHESIRQLSETKIISYGKTSYTVNAYRMMGRDRFYVRGLLSFFALANVIGFIASYFAGKYLSERIVKPIKQMTDTARLISASDLSGRIPEAGPDDELMLLAVTFNNMIDRLKISFDKQTAFVSDASHELKTPISVIQGYASLLSRWGKDDPEILREAVDSIKNETEHMTMLVKKLLFLSKGDQSAVNAQMRFVSLPDIVDDIKKEFEICNPDRTLIVTETAQQDIMADYDLIKQLIWVFLDNAVKYSADDADIFLTVFEKDGAAAFSVEDKGIGLNDEELPYIFDRFYRADKSRSKVIRGTGLGLSIAKLIIDIHKAHVNVISKAGEGTRIDVWF